MDAVTQPNAASAVESSVAAADLSREAGDLAAMVTTFELEEHGRPGAHPVRHARNGASGERLPRARA